MPMPDARTCDTADDPALAAEPGRGFGAFTRALDSLPAATIGEVIPAFHGRSTIWIGRTID